VGLRGIHSNPLSGRGPAFASGPPFSAEVIALFVELEGLIDAGVRRDNHEFRERSLVLAVALGLVGEWWTIDDVFDRGGPSHPPGYCAHDNWHRCRVARNALLAAVAEQAALGPQEQPTA
jgi:hypothetical protein